MSILEVERLTKQFRGLTAVRNLSFAVEAGEIVGLIGPNGAGKSTCFNLISGLLRPTDGTFRFRGEEIVGLKPHQIARRGLVRTFQQSAAFMGLSVGDNIRTAGFLTVRPSVVGPIFGTARHRDDQRRIDEAVERVADVTNLTAYLDVPAANLSYGHLRRLGLAVALAAAPRCLLLDEPAAGLNSSESNELLAAIRTIAGEGTTVVIVEHDMKMIMSLCDRIVVLNHGEKIAEGTPDQVRRDPEVIRSYLGGAPSQSHDAKGEPC